MDAAAKTAEERIAAADALAARAHAGQVQGNGAAYIEHPRTVASFLSDPVEKVVALLHDTLEDTDTTEEELREQFGETVAQAVSMLTRRDGEDYFDYIDRVRQTPLTRHVKLADLRHNMDLSRLPEITEYALKRNEKYRRARDILLAAEAAADEGDRCAATGAS